MCPCVCVCVCVLLNEKRIIYIMQQHRIYVLQMFPLLDAVAVTTTFHFLFRVCFIRTVNRPRFDISHFLTEQSTFANLNQPPGFCVSYSVMQHKALSHCTHTHTFGNEQMHFFFTLERENAIHNKVFVRCKRSQRNFPDT